jgi:hypothetical protein
VNISKRKQPNQVTEPDKILKELVKSKAKGNVLGICARPFGSNMYLTAIEDIKDIDSTADQDKLVVLKKHDLQGNIIDSHELCLSEVVSVRPFRKKYPENPSLFDHAADLIEPEPAIKIRCLEQTITTHDLRIILVRIINSGYRIAIHLRGDTDQTGDFYYVISFTAREHYEVAVSPTIHPTTLHTVRIDDIDLIAFEAFFYFKGLASKIFRIM